MSELTLQQVERIEKAINERRGASVLKSELLDHICTSVEAYMADGHSFEAALMVSLSGFGNDEIRKVSRQVVWTHKYYHLKRQPLTWLTPVMAICLLFVVVSVGAKDRPDRKPTAADFRISSGFGNRMHPILKELKMHRGVDIAIPVGTSIVATASGVVGKIENMGKQGYGLHITLKHEDGYETVYAQLSEVKVKAGDKVEKGQLIALSGNSGLSTAPHLHYEVIHNGEWVDPSLYFGEGK